MQHTKILFFCSLLILFGCGKDKSEPQGDKGLIWSEEIRLATYNIRYDNPNDEGNLWKDRKLIMPQLINKYDFDIIGMQEAYLNQINDLKAALPQYEWIGISRDGSSTSGEFCPIFYKPEKFELLKSGNFWLSTTPSTPGKGWDAALNRICTWAQFKDKKSDYTFYVFNTHFDHVGEQARLQSANLMQQKIREIAGNTATAFMTGDLNFDQNHPNYSTIVNGNLLKDTYSLALSKLNATRGTLNSFNPNSTRTGRIDHIFATGGTFVRINYWAVLTDSYSGKVPSDHFPVMARVLLGEIK
ncbi:MAG TPA: endonuclease/exonuclease/phosphatase family protein [Sphingobacterium sp.]|nr:endonuclease/exonuclease/phosphatase family protein [Sphingobacterium sp.]